MPSEPIRLLVGQTTDMRFPEGVDVWESSIAAPSIAEFSFAPGGKCGIVDAGKPGTTSITLFEDEAVAAHCEGVVR